jgi:hypothetical protein
VPFLLAKERREKKFPGNAEIEKPSRLSTTLNHERDKLQNKQEIQEEPPRE